MPITEMDDWEKCVKNNRDPYGGACIQVAREVMRLLDERTDFNAGDLISEADDSIKAGGITGFMAGAVAAMVSHCHSRGDEFKKSWNGGYGQPGATGVVNPAILVSKTEE